MLCQNEAIHCEVCQSYPSGRRLKRESHDGKRLKRESHDGLTYPGCSAHRSGKQRHAPHSLMGMSAEPGITRHGTPKQEWSSRIAFSQIKRCIP